MSLFLALLLLFSLAQSTKYKKPSPHHSEAVPEIYVLLGDRYHNGDYIRTHFNRLFSEMNKTYDYSFNYEDLDLTLLKNYKLFIFFRDGLIYPSGYIGPDAYPYVTGLMNNPPQPNASTWVNDDLGVAIQSYVSGGGNLYSYHQNTNVANYSTTYRTVLGGVYVGHPDERPFQVQVVNRSHPITQGVNDFMVTDEQHFPQFDLDPSYMLLRGVNLDGLTYEGRGTTSVAGWAYTYGGGRVVHSAPGHNLDVLWKDDYLTFQKNAIRWLLREI